MHFTKYKTSYAISPCHCRLENNIFHGTQLKHMSVNPGPLLVNKKTVFDESVIWFCRKMLKFPGQPERTSISDVVLEKDVEFSSNNQNGRVSVMWFYRKMLNIPRTTKKINLGVLKEAMRHGKIITSIKRDSYNSWPQYQNIKSQSYCAAGNKYEKRDKRSQGEKFLDNILKFLNNLLLWNENTVHSRQSVRDMMMKMIWIH